LSRSFPPSDFNTFTLAHFYTLTLLQKTTDISGLGDAVGHDVCLNSPLIRRGELMVCSPTDALYGSDLQFLIMENVLVKTPDAPEY
jgi:hypothetical protein